MTSNVNPNLTPLLSPVHPSTSGFTHSVSYACGLGYIHFSFPPIVLNPHVEIPKAVSYYVQLQVISQSLGTLHSDQNGLLQLSAKAHCQPVCPCARPVIGWPGVCDEGSASSEDVCCPSCKKRTKEMEKGGYHSVATEICEDFSQMQVKNTEKPSANEGNADIMDSNGDILLYFIHMCVL